MHRLVIAAILILSMPAMSMPAKILVEWNFDSPDDAWTPADKVAGLTVKDGCLVGRSVDRDPNITGPAFEIQANPWQYVEIRMKCSKDGHGELYYSNNTEGQYHGFRPDWVQTIEYKAGDFQTYRLLPFWQDLGKIVRIRIDPPEDAEFAIDYIRINEIEVPTSDTAFFDLTRYDVFWCGFDGRLPNSTEDGIGLLGVDTPNALSPRIAIEAESYPWLALMGEFRQPISLQWVTDKLPGVRSYTIQPNPAWGSHVYNISTEQLLDWVGTIRMLGVAVPNDGFASVRFVGATTKRMGPAEVQIRHFGFKDAVNRVGKTAIVQAEIVNVGGEAAEDIRVSLRFPSKIIEGLMKLGNIKGSWHVGNPEQSIDHLGPGESRTVSWEVLSPIGGSYDAHLRLTQDEKRIAYNTTSLRWYPALDVKSAAYVPEPKPVRGDIEVGMYYFPGWATYARWSVLDDFPERRPVLGYYREGDPEVADWQIKWMVEHGVTFICYDWYWSAGGRSLEQGLDAFFKSRYHDKIKFCLLWANHNAPGTSSAEDMVNVTDYWLANYFLRPDYFKIEGKPVVVIFSPHRLTEDMGVPGVKAAFDKSREMAKAKGLPGIYFVGCVGPNRGQLAALEAEGYDAASGYNYPSAGDKGQIVAPYDDMVTGYKEIWDTIAGLTTLPYFPVTEPGWDSRPWHGPNARARTGKTPEKFKQMLVNAREFLKERSPKVMLIEAWNEFGEGDYTEPHQEFGFGHLDAIREVFTSAPKEHEDIVPEDVGLGPYELEKPKPVTAWEFDDPKSPGWDPTQNLTGGKVEDGCLTAVSNGVDPAIYSGITEIQASKYPAIEIRMKVDKGRGAQLFWAPRGRGFVELASAKFEIIADGEFHVYRLDLAANPAWKSTITAFRLDPTDAKDAHISLDYVRFFRQ